MSLRNKKLAHSTVNAWIVDSKFVGGEWNTLHLLKTTALRSAVTGWAFKHVWEQMQKQLLSDAHEPW